MLTQRPSAQGANRAPAAKTQPQCPPRCTVVASTSGRQQAPEAQGQASMARRHLLGLPVLLLPIISASPARAEIPPKLPGNAVPGATPIPDGDAFLITAEDAAKLVGSERQVYAANRRIQAQNRAPEDFPGFVRSGFDVKVVGEFKTDDNGLFYRDYIEGYGPTPLEGQEVVFHYTGYNESGSIIDSSYRQGRPAQTRLGVKGLIPGFEIGLRGMKQGQVRRIIIPPALGPPVGPQTFFSAKQCEIFDIEMIRIRNCERRQMAMFSDVVCTDI